MKKSITFLFLLISVVYLFGQHKAQEKNIPDPFQPVFKKNESLRELKQKIKSERRFPNIQQFERSLKKRSNTSERIYLDSLLTQVYNQSSMEFFTVYKYDFIYNDEDQIITILDYDWTSSGYELYERWSFEYESHGRISSLIIDYPGTGGFIFDLRLELNYDIDGNLIRETFSEWIDGAWLEVERVLYTFDNNVLMMYVIEYFDENDLSWYAETRTTNSYNNGNLTTIITEDYDFEEENWTLSTKVNQSFDNDLLVELLLEFWDEVEEIWIPYYIEVYAYDGNGNQTSKLINIFSFITDEWEHFSRYEYYYENNRLVQEINFIWDEDELFWEEESRSDITYNGEIDPSQTLVVPDFIYFQLSSDPIDMEVNLKFENGEWIFDNRQTYHYSQEGTTSVTDLSIPGFNIYPNPASHTLFLEFEYTAQPLTLQIFDIKGRLIHMDMGINKNAIDVSRFIPGLYVYRIGNQQYIQTGKFNVVR
ncbi:MAG TPA: T9SS type A sorting domain-containing protein [Saprospiraceae bacterium]|nr:T9SS type A sorting domain-containing protein [Saprospiraceae bacterium]